MLKQIVVVECDICGKTEQPGEDYNLPDGWVHSDTNRKFFICPKCWHKLSGGDHG